ncbi:P-loop containing nucleoside triphosphate hydrolase protein [Parachaetomium inaequale]|uniref:P-loop containing nucleoside triphosphate hydrolase protein n=1 Tax=Parachaetomium inaequale TaxID=2588326 RepID=A0AAN6P3S3_9PEZI|nr:P-loop containing nucleoside triphosphate hydrolase protein [Parachaetomium inaequale]
MPSSAGDTSTYVAKPKECALSFRRDGEFRILGGKKMGYPDNHRATFLFTNPSKTNLPHVAIRISFPTVEVPYASFSTIHGAPELARVITIKLMVGTWTSSAEVLLPEKVAELPPRANAKKDDLVLLRFKLKDGERARAENFGIPAACEHPEDQAILDGDALIDGAISLRDLCRQSEFFVLVPGYTGKVASFNNQLREYFPREIQPVFPYANGGWDPSRYAAEIPTFAKTMPYDANIKFDSRQDCAVSIAHGVAQDTFYLIQDVHDIRRHRVECAFLRTVPDSDDVTAQEFLVLVWHHLDNNNYGDSLSRLLHGDAQLGFAFSPPPADKERDVKYWPARQIPLDDWKHTGCDLAMTIRRPYRKTDPGRNISNQAITAFDTYTEDTNEKIAEARVAGVKVLWEDPALIPDIKKAAEVYDKAVLNLYKADLFTGSGFDTLAHPLEPLRELQEGEDDDVDAITQAKNAMAATQNRRSLPQVDIFDTDASEKDRGQLQDLIAEGLGAATYKRFCKYMMINRLGVIPVVGFAGSGKTHLSCYAALLFMTARSIGPLYCAAPTHVATTDFAERLFKLGTEVFMKLGWPVPLVVRGYIIRKDLDAFEAVAKNMPLRDVGEDPYSTTTWSMHLSPCEWLLKVVGVGGYDLTESDPAAMHTIRTKFRTEDKYRSLHRFLQGEFGFRQKPSKDEDEPWRVAEELLEDIIMAAEAVCTTPYLSSQGIYARFNQARAKGIVLEDAGAMHEADALLVMHHGCRPVILAGDRKHLTPMVISHGQNREGRCVNMFSTQSKVSVLEKLERSGWLCFVLSTQYRMAFGSFDLAGSIIYPGVKDFKYAESTALANHPMATKIETWAVSTFRATPSPAGKVLPLFIHCGNSRCLVDEAAGSRYNDRQNGLVVNLVQGLLELGVESSDIAVITPYRSNLARLEQALKHKDVAVNTTDSFPGGQASVIIFALVVDQTSGPLFVQDTHRLCVGITSHVDALFVVGDINTVGNLRAKGANALSGRNTVFYGLLRYFVDNQRVVYGTPLAQ